MKRLVIIDGKSVFYRGYYAMGALSLPDGTPTGGIYGFAAIAMEIVKRLNPTKVVVAWDSKTSVSKRRAIFKDYKAGRVKPGKDFYAQIPYLKELIKNLGWEFIELDDYEADDIIGTLSRLADESADETGKCNYETFIISSDLDMLQIVDANTHMWRILKGFTNIEQIDVKEIEEKYGIKKSQFLDLKALKGDSSDNIPGVPGIGEKTAVKLLNEYGDLDGIYNNIDNITGSTKAKLEAGKDSAYMSKTLAKIMFDAPVSLADIPDFHFDKSKTIEALRALRFNSLIRKIEGNDFEKDVTRGLSESENNAFSEHNRQRGDYGATEPHNDGSEGAFRKSINSDSYDIIAYDIKSLMHSNPDIAQKILSGSSFWDLSQAAFLLNPLEREAPTLSVAEETQALQFQTLSSIPKLFDIYQNFDLPLIPILFKMEEKLK